VTAKSERKFMAEDKKKKMAEIYGYETKNFKRQVKYNIAKFEGDDFMCLQSREYICL